MFPSLAGPLFSIGPHGPQIRYISKKLYEETCEYLVKNVKIFFTLSLMHNSGLLQQVSVNTSTNDLLAPIRRNLQSTEGNGLRKLGNICCGHKTFLTKNSLCVPDTNFVSATNVAHAGKRGNICVGNNVSSLARALKAWLN